MSAAVTIDGLRFVPDTSEPGFVCAVAIPAARARTLCAALIAGGREASWAPDHDDRTLAWVYVASDPSGDVAS